MALITADRVKETSTTTGTGTLTLAGAVNGFKSFADIGNGNQCYYAIVGVAVPSEWEVGIGTYTASGTTLSRDVVLRSSTGSKVSFSAGAKEVFVTYPADHSVSQADVGTAPNQIPLNQYLGSMAYEDNDNVNITGGVATVSRATITNIENNTDISNVEPSLLLDFAKAKTLDPRITFARASAATYYDGKTVSKAEENLVLYSQEFNNNTYWTYQNVTVSANATAAPDGTSTAESMLEAANTAFHGIIRSVPTVSGVAHTASVYVKANGRNYFLIYTNAGSLGKYFDITAGGGGSVLGNYGAGPTSAAISYIGNDWYRCSITFNTTNTSTFIELYVSETGSNASYAGDATKGIYIWGAQLEQRSSVSAYTPTTTQPITNYIPTLLSAPANVARFDHDSVTAESKGLLIEEQRANLVLYSEQFDNAAWTKGNATITANQVIAPDGTLTADVLTNDSTNGEHRVYRTHNAGSATTTQSVYAKAGSASFISINGGTTSFAYAVFDLSSGSVVSSAFSTGSITSVGNGWYRCSVNPTGGSAISNLVISVGETAAQAVPGVSYVGTGKHVFIWGAQAEAGTFPTSYIKTEGSQVTRSADAASMTGTNFSSWYNASEGTLYADASGIYGVSGTNYFVACVDDNTVNNEFVIRRAETQLQVVSNTNTVTYAALTSSFAASNLSAFKIAGAYKVDSFAASFSGGAASEDTSGIVVSGANTFRIGSPAAASGGRRGMTGYIRKIAYYPKRLANAELVEMTA